MKGGKMKQLLENPSELSSFIRPPSSDVMERETRLELATLALARRCSTTELLPLSKRIAFLKVVDEMYPFFYPSVKRHLDRLRVSK
jgi:hypothetical protein